MLSTSTSGRDSAAILAPSPPGSSPGRRPSRGSPARGGEGAVGSADVEGAGVLRSRASPETDLCEVLEQIRGGPRREHIVNRLRTECPLHYLDSLLVAIFPRI